MPLGFGKSILSTVAAAAADTFASILFDGTGDYLQVDEDSARTWDQFGKNGETGTIEAWVYVDDNTTRNQLIIHRTAGTAAQGWGLEARANEGTGTIIWFAAGRSNNPFATGVISSATWHHVACDFNGRVVTIYVDGSSVASNTISADAVNANGDLRIGDGEFVIANAQLDGNMQDIRISTTRRYTTSFTPPTPGSLSNDSATMLLITGRNMADGDTDFTDESDTGHTVTANGNAQADTDNLAS